MLWAQRPLLALPARLWLCGIPQIADAIERLAGMRQQVAEAALQRARAADKAGAR